jgi:hypothetical protein
MLSRAVALSAFAQITMAKSSTYSIGMGAARDRVGDQHSPPIEA